LFIANRDLGCRNVEKCTLYLQDECSFVSLRDVDRALQVMMWFYSHRRLFDKIDEKAQQFFEKLAEDQGAVEVQYEVRNCF
jgi:hypothetical protein